MNIQCRDIWKREEREEKKKKKGKHSDTVVTEVSK